MKIILNKSWGGISDESALKRFDPDFIKAVESGDYELRASDTSWGHFVEDLCVIEIPDDITDYKIIEYDGVEAVIYVLNGKIFCEPENDAYNRIFNHYLQK